MPFRPRPSSIIAPIIVGSKSCRMLFRSGALIFVMLVAVLITAVSVNAGDRFASEYQIKAAYIYNFAAFTEWSTDSFDGPESPLAIGVLGNDPFGNALDDAIKDKTVEGRRLVVKRSSHIRDLERCQVLFICESEESRMVKDLEAVADRKMLTVSDIDGFAKRGGVVGFTYNDGKVGFEVNIKRAKAARIKISSKMLKLAHVVDK